MPNWPALIVVLSLALTRLSVADLRSARPYFMAQMAVPIGRTAVLAGDRRHLDPAMAAVAVRRLIACALAFAAGAAYFVTGLVLAMRWIGLDRSPGSPPSPIIGGGPSQVIR